MNIIQQFEAEQIARLTATRGVPDFIPGDTLRVSVKVVEGERTRVQAFEGVCIARSNKGLNSNFTVRKISYGEGVERVFPLYAPTIAEIMVVRRGDVRRAKLYYLRGRSGKSARIAERARSTAPVAAPAETAAAGVGTGRCLTRQRPSGPLIPINGWVIRSVGCRLQRPSCSLLITHQYRGSKGGPSLVGFGAKPRSSSRRPLHRDQEVRDLIL